MYTLPELPYGFDALEPHIDAQTMQIHHDKHHQTYVDKLNAALEGNEKLLNLTPVELMSRLDEVPEDRRTAVRNNGGGHVNHSFFWEIMSPEPTDLNDDLVDALKQTFGDLYAFKDKFKAEALAVFGSGWVWLCKDETGLHIETTGRQDNPWMQGHTPILGLDVWEHAYYVKYQNKRPDYVDAWWNVVNWSKVAELYTT